MRQRSKPRVDVMFPVQFLGDAAIGRGMLVNLSGPGCAVTSKTPMAIGSYVSLQIKIPRRPDPLVIAVALVRWAQGDQFGLEFIRYGNGGKAQLAKLLDGNSHELLVAMADPNLWKD